MNAPIKLLLIDRDGTLVEEPFDQQVDSLAKIRFMPGVFAALQQLQRAGYRFAMVTNQDGLGTDSFPQADFDLPHRFILEAFASQGLVFDDVFICPHKPADNCACRKPRTLLVDDWLAARNIDRKLSAVIGDRDTDMAFAGNLGLQGVRVRVDGTADETWPAVVAQLLSRRATVQRQTRETHIKVEVNLDAEGPIHIATGLAFFDHMLEQLAKHGGFAMQLDCKGDLQVDEHHTVEDCALAIGEVIKRALGDKLGIGRYGFLLAMDEAQAQVAIDLSGRAYPVFEGSFNRTEVGGLATELVPHFFRSLGDTLGAAIHVAVRGDNTHHMVEACFKGVGRALRQAFRREGNELPSTKGVL